WWVSCNAIRATIGNFDVGAGYARSPESRCVIGPCDRKASAGADEPIDWLRGCALRMDLSAGAALHARPGSEVSQANEYGRVPVRRSSRAHAHAQPGLFPDRAARLS